MVTGALARAGAERQMIALAHGLHHHGYTIEVLELQGLATGQPSFQKEMTALGVKLQRVSQIPAPAGNGLDSSDNYGLQAFDKLLPLNITSVCTALAQTIKTYRPSIVHCWSDFSNLVGGFLSLRMRVPRIVLGLRVMPPPLWFEQPEADLYREAYSALLANPKVALINNSAVSRKAFENWMGLPTGAIDLVHNGFVETGIHIRSRSQISDCRAALGLPNDGLVVGAVMRFAREKDPDLWLETAAAIACVRPDVYFVLAGYGHDDVAEQLAKKGAQLGLGNRLFMPGAMVDVGQVYGAIDTLLLTSRTENVPNVLIEAQAAGVPVVGPNVGGIGEAMLHETTGLLVSERSASALAEAVLRILSNPDWVRQVASDGPGFVAQRFGHERMVRQTISIYNRTRPNLS
jgi:glycosyltransferase involved in cell wall biosynthesis